MNEMPVAFSSRTIIQLLGLVLLALILLLLPTEYYLRICPTNEQTTRRN